LFDAQDLTAQHHALPTTLGMKANRIYVDHGLLALRRRTSILDLTTVLTTTVTTVAVSATPPTRRFGAVLAWLLRLPAPGSAEVASCRSWRVPGKRCHRVVTTRYVHAGTGGDAQGASLQVDDFQGTHRDPANSCPADCKSALARIDLGCRSISFQVHLHRGPRPAWAKRGGERLRRISAPTYTA
jgi:hypothetical protein